MPRVIASGRQTVSDRVAMSGRRVIRNMHTNLRFDGSGGIQIGAQLQNPGSFTFATWFKKTRSGASEMLVGHSTETAKIGFFNGNFFVRVLNGGTSDSSMAEPRDFGWHFLIITRDTSNIVRFSLDGSTLVPLFSSATQSGNWTIHRLARSETGQNFIGNMEETRCWSFAFNDSQVSALYYRNEMTRNGLYLEYLYDEGSGTTADDTSSTGVDGTISGATYSSDAPIHLRSQL